MTNDTEAFTLDKRQMRRSFDRAAPNYDRAAVLQREVGRRMLERLDLVRLQPDTTLDVGCGTGELTQRLRTRYPKANTIGLDLAMSMLQLARRRQPLWKRWRNRTLWICGDAESLPLASKSVALICSNLTLQWCMNLDNTFADMQRILKPEGLLMFTTFGPDTLKELRRAWSQVDGYNHVNAFLDMHDVGDALMRAGFANPVMDTETITLTYRNAVDLMRDLKAIGAHNVTAGRRQGLTGKTRVAQFAQAYEAFRRDGLLPATYEVVYGHAWGTATLPRQPFRDR